MPHGPALFRGNHKTGYTWSDSDWIRNERSKRFGVTRPVSIYEVHLGSWMRVPEENNRMLTYRELAPKLADYAGRMGYTHVQLLDAMGDHGVNERHGTAADFAYLVDHLHQRELGVIVDWKWVEGIPGPDQYHVDAISSRVARGAHADIEVIAEGAQYAWDAGFAHDIRAYLEQPPAKRKLHHRRLTFRRMYAYQENYILPLSHKERGLLARMPGDEWQQFANLRLLLAYMYFQTGKKLLFMGHDFGQWREWNQDMSLDWHLMQFRYHAGTHALVSRLNDLYQHETALHEGDAKAECFEWIDCEDAERSTVSWLRWDVDFREVFLVIFNFTPTVHRNFKVGAPRGGEWREMMNTDASEYGGSGQGNFGRVKAAPFGWQGRPHSLFITLPPLAAVAFKSER